MAEHVCSDHSAEVHVIIAGLDEVLDKRSEYLYRLVTGEEHEEALRTVTTAFRTDIAYTRGIMAVADVPLVYNNAHNAS